MKKLFALILIIAAILVGLYFYTDGEILQGRLDLSGPPVDLPSLTDGSILKIQSINLNDDRTVTVVLGNTSTAQLSKTFTAQLFLDEDGEPDSIQRFPALKALTGTTWTSNPLSPGEHKVTVCLDVENVIEDVDNCLTQSFIVQE